MAGCGRMERWAHGRLLGLGALPAARDVLVLTARNRLVAAAACGELVLVAW